MIVDHINNWRRYGFGPAWEETMRWLENYAPGGSGSLADLTDGTHPLTDGFVSVATLTSRPLSGSLYECHKRFCDVQMVVEGQEWLFNAATTGLSLDGPFDDQRDVGFFQPAPAEVSRVTLSPGTFALLFPWDAHLPAIAVDGLARLEGLPLLHVKVKRTRMDIFDQAQELERLARETALQRARSSQYWEGPEWIDGQACCRECGEPIPQKRLEALPGVGLCRACQEEREREGF